MPALGPAPKRDATQNCEVSFVTRDIPKSSVVTTVHSSVDFYDGPSFGNIRISPNHIIETSTDSDSEHDYYLGTDNSDYIDVKITAPDNEKFDPCSKFSTTHAGGGNDYVSGSHINDWILGGPGSDYLSGGHGDDRLAGGRDNDLLIGGLGLDTFYMLNDGSHDKVLDFNWAHYDRINLDDMFQNNSGKAVITEYRRTTNVNGDSDPFLKPLLSQNEASKGFDTFLRVGDTIMQFEGVRGWEVYDSVMENDNMELVASNFQILGGGSTPSEASSGGDLIDVGLTQPAVAWMPY